MEEIKTDQPKPFKNKKLIFDDDGEVISEEVNKHKRKEGKSHKRAIFKTQTTNENNIRKHKSENTEEAELKWFEVYTDYNTGAEPIDLKDRELNELRVLCKNSFASESVYFKSKNPSDAKWLETALYKGTSKDRANAGALLVTTNPLANLKTLETLIGQCKFSNKSSVDVVSVLTELFIESLLPSNRKLMSVELRGADWKALQKLENISKETKQKIFSYWHYEGELKEIYFEFLKNLQQTIQNGQDVNKNTSIIAASKLLTNTPEKEQMLLSMLINKLGDPSNKVASKALHHLSEVAYKHPNMCGVITNETEKLLFRNNIAERAQHYALCFLAQLAHNGHTDVCTKLVNICFSFFKLLVKKGAVNSKTMQAILRCLQKAIVDAKPPAGSTEIMTKDMQDTIYRLVHLADIQISIQTLSLLLQLVAVKSEKSDRFYNALYRKMLDLNVTNVGHKTAAQFLHIVHRAIHIDQNIRRAQAFIKRLLQIAFYMPAQMVCGCLIVINKLLKMRPELDKDEERCVPAIEATEEVLAKFDSDGEEKYEDIHLEEDKISESKEAEKMNDNPDFQQSSWYHAKNTVKPEDKNVSEISATKYDPYNRVPAFAGAEYAMKSELVILQEHFHPTVKVFAENILSKKKVDYYGDPLKDFSLTHFLERFAFKNPKKLSEEKIEPKTPIQIIHNKSYFPRGTRGKPVSTLTKTNCTEEELFIFNYLEKKRENKVITKADDDEDLQSVDDDEFEEYLDGLCKKSKHKENDDDDEEDDLDYLKELGGDLSLTMEKKKKKKTKEVEDDGEGNEIDNDWGDDDDISDLPSDELESDEDGSISIDEDESDDNMGDSSENNSSDQEDEPKAKKRKNMTGKYFEKSLKNKTDVSSLFAAADDFAELLEDTGKVKGHGTSNAVFNKDKSSEKQMKWEEKRRSNVGRKFENKKKFGKFNSSKKNKRKV